MKESWQSKKLGDLCDIGLGKTPARDNPKFWDTAKLTENVWLSIADLLSAPSGVAVDSKEYLSVLGAALSKPVKRGTLMVSFKLTLGRLAFAGRDLFTNEAIAALTIRDEKIISKEFLYYFLQYFDWDEATVGEEKVKGRTLNKAKLKEIVVQFPGLTEQQRIVAILDETFVGIASAKANAEKNLQNARELFESHRNNLMTPKVANWRCVLVEDVCDSITDCVNKTAPVVDGPTPFKMIRTTNIRDGKVDVDSVRYVTEDVYKTWTRRQTPVRGDVLLTREAPMGEVGMLLTDELVFLGQRIVAYRANSELLDNRFLLHAFQARDVQAQIKKLASGSTVQHMRVPDSKTLQISLPPICEQKDIVRRIDELLLETEQLESVFVKKLAALDELKQSLLAKAFAGELT